MPSPLDPLSKFAGRASPHYTVTYLLTVAFAFAVACITYGISTTGIARALQVSNGIMLGIAAFGLTGYLMFQKPEMLRSEPHLQFLAIMAWSQQPALDEAAIGRRERMFPKMLKGELESPSLTYLPTMMRAAMSEQNYVAVFDLLDERFNPIAIQQAVQFDNRATHWWNHIVNCFLVTFNGDSDELATLLSTSSEEVRFFVMQVDPRDSDGILANQSWLWIKKRELELADKSVKQAS